MLYQFSVYLRVPVPVFWTCIEFTIDCSVLYNVAHLIDTFCEQNIMKFGIANGRKEWHN